MAKKTSFRAMNDDMRQNDKWHDQKFLFKMFGKAMVTTFLILFKFENDFLRMKTTNI